jgi:hypothetical protein
VDLRFEFTIVVLWCSDLTPSVCRSLCGLSALVNAARAGVTRNRSQHLEWTCWAAYRKEREREIWFERDNIKPWTLWKCRRVSAHLALRAILVQAYDNQQQKGRSKTKHHGGMSVSRGIHRGFPGKPSTSIKSWESRKLKSAQLVLSDKTKPYFSKLKSAMVKIRWKVALSKSRSGM